MSVAHIGAIHPTDGTAIVDVLKADRALLSEAGSVRNRQWLLTKLGDRHRLTSMVRHGWTIDDVIVNYVTPDDGE